MAAAPEMLDTLHQIFTDPGTPDYIKALILPVIKTASGDNELKMPVGQAPQYNTIGILEVPADQIPPSVYDALHNTDPDSAWYQYWDTNQETHLFPADIAKYPAWNLEQKAVLTAIRDLCEKNKCSYFRIVTV